ncbi:MAG: Nif11 family protein [Chlorobiales bacterium]|nr:Nif11 family protein [Chlorobiales bacterium]
MSIANAQRFVRRMLTDTEMRKRLNSAQNHDARQIILREEDLSFTEHEFDEGFRNMLVNCQTYERAEDLQQIRMWWELLRKS